MNKIYLANNLDMLEKMKDESVDLVYIDPPFNTGKTQKRTRIKATQNAKGERVGFGDKKYSATKLTKVSPEYSDNYTDYNYFIGQRLTHLRRILKPTGSIFVHLDYRSVHAVKFMLLDPLFGEKCFQNELVWIYDFGGRSKKRWSAKHDNILWYTKHPTKYTFNYDAMDRIPYLAPGLVGKEKAKRGKTPTDCWWQTIVPTNGKEKTGYPTQKPLKLLERIVRVHTNPQDVVLDCFCGCFDDTTEVLTDSGWKLFDDVADSDKICSLNPTDHRIEYVGFCKRIKYKHSGRMFSIKGRSVDLLVTPDHKIYTKEVHQKSYKLFTVSAFTYSAFHKLPYGNWESDEKWDLNWLRFIGFWLGDGYKQTKSRKNHGHVIGFHLKKYTSIQYIRSLLDRLKIRYNVYTEKTGHSRIVIRDKYIYGKLEGNTYTKRVPKFIFGLSKECAQAVLDGYAHADGTVSSWGSPIYYSCNRDLLSDVQRLVLHAGYSSTLSARNRTKNSVINGRKINCSRTQYTLSTHAKNKQLRLTKDNISQVLDYEGFVYDFTLNRNHILYVRRNGRCCWSGNSGTTGEAAGLLGRSFILVDSNKDAVRISAKRLKKYKPKCIGFSK